MSAERQEVFKTFCDDEGKWIPFRLQREFDDTNVYYACDIQLKGKDRPVWKQYGVGNTEIVALRNAKNKWNEEQKAAK